MTPYFTKKSCYPSTEIYLRGYFTSIFTDIVLYYCNCCCYCYLMLLLSSFLTKTQNSRKNRNIKHAVSGLRQVLATESSLKWRKILSISPQKLFSFSRYLSFCLYFLVMYRKGLIKKIKVNFKFYDVTAWLTSSFNTHIAQYEILRCLILFLVIPCNNFPFRAFVTMIYWTSIKVLLNLLVRLDSAVSSLDF